MFTAICLLLNGCVLIVEPIIPTDTDQTEFIATEIAQVSPATSEIPIETATPTLEPTITKTPLPTIDKHPPTPTVERPVEWDIDPYIEREIEGEYKGVKIKASVIIDRSLEPLVEGIYVNNNLLSEMIAKILAYVWYSRQVNYRGTIYSYFQFEDFTSDEMDKWFGLWAKAQETGLEYYWRQVQLDNIWVNDLNDGDGYVQKPYAFWPMYDGPTPYGVTALGKITVVLFDTPKSVIKNLTTIATWAQDGVAVSSNLDNSNLIFYSGQDVSTVAKRIEDEKLYSQKLATQITLQMHLYPICEYLIWNDGIADFPTDDIFFVVPSDIAKIFERVVEYKLKIE